MNPDTTVPIHAVGFESWFHPLRVLSRTAASAAAAFTSPSMRPSRLQLTSPEVVMPLYVKWTDIAIVARLRHQTFPHA